MKRTLHFLIFAGCLLLAPLISSGQLDIDGLKQQLEGKESFTEITATVEQFLVTAPDTYEKEKFEKKFARWAWYQSMHLGPDGEFVNVAKRTFEAVQQKPVIEESDNRSANGTWTFVGPHSVSLTNPSADILGNGRADRIAFVPGSANTYYVGTPSGGLWKTSNDGSTWTCLTNYIPSLGISGIVVDHSNTNRIYVLTGDGDTYGDNYLVVLAGYHRLSQGVLVSNDGGITWEQTGELFNGEYVGYRLVQHPTNADILLAATSEGIYRTTNGGDTWVLERAGKTFDIEFKPGTPSRVYASQVAGFVYSTNTGDTWNTNATFSHSLCAGGRVEIAVTPNASNRVYLLAGPMTGGNTFCGFFRSTDSGLNFTRLCNSPNVLGTETGGGSDQSMYDMALAVSPTNYNIVVVGGLCTYRSTNGGTTFVNATTYREGGGNYIHPDIHGIEFNPHNSYVYALGDGGIHRSTNNGQTYTDIYTGLNTAQFYGMDDYNGNVYAMIAGCQDNGVKYKNSSGSAFDQVYCCDGADAIINYNNVNTGYAVVNTRIKYFSNFTTTSPSDVANTGFFPEIELHASDPTLMIYGYSDIRRYDSDLGTSTSLSTHEGWWATKTCPSNSNRIYAAGGNSYYATTGDMVVSSDGGSSWTTISGGGGFPASYPRISDIGVKPNNSGQVWVTFSGYTDNVKVYYSSNAGTNWYNRSYDLPNMPVWTIEVDGANNVYVGTEYGVFYLASGATSWEPFYNNLPNVPVSELAINETGDQLLAATFGRGIWKSTLRDPCPTSVYLSSDLEGQYFRSASSTITSVSEVVGGEGTDVYLRAGLYVDLEPGFVVDAKVGNDFLAYLGPCGSGMPPDMAFDVFALPEELSGYNITFSREKGTLEVPPANVSSKWAKVRVFREGNVRVILATSQGKYIRDIVTDFSARQGSYDYSVETAGLDSGLYYLYLIIDDEVAHLQEMEL